MDSKQLSKRLKSLGTNSQTPNQFLTLNFLKALIGEMSKDLIL
jgi:hypothetical protein